MAKEHDYYLESTPVPETPSPGAPPKPWGKTRVVGKGLPKIDAYERVSGRAVYPPMSPCRACSTGRSCVLPTPTRP